MFIPSNGLVISLNIFSTEELTCSVAATCKIRNRNASNMLAKKLPVRIKKIYKVM